MPSAVPSTDLWKRVLLRVGGAVLLVLAALGAVLPLLPTAPFVLLAGACFLRAWPRGHAWLEKHPFFGPFLRGGKRPRLPRAAKWTAFAIAFVSFGATLVFALSETTPRLIVLALAVCVLGYLGTLPVADEATD